MDKRLVGKRKQFDNKNHFLILPEKEPFSQKKTAAPETMGHFFNYSRVKSLSSGWG
jgi:hypothetical protein